MATPAQTGPIAVYGATGYTGRLVCEELGRRGAEFIAAGRNPAKLEALAGDLGGGVPTRAVETGDATGLRALLEPCAAVIACAGPFCEHGEPVLAAAAETGTNYLDTTGEQPFIALVFDRYGDVAESTGAALVTAMGFDYAPGDMIAALTAEGMGPLEEITLAYSVRNLRMTRGTTLSGIGMLTASELSYADGRLRPSDRGLSRGNFTFPEPVGTQPMARYPSGEPITVPRHVEVRTVRTMLTAATMAPPRAVRLLPALVPAFGAAMRTPLRSLAERLVDRLPEGPDPEARRAARWMIVCEARPVGGGASRRGVISGSDVYGLTAVTIAEGALRLAAEGYRESGALAPSEAFGPTGFLDSLEPFGVTREVETAGERIARSELMAIGERNRPAVPLEAGIGPENPPCPACGEPLFGWAMVRPAGLPVRRCERCGLAVKGGPAERDEAEDAAAAALGDGEAPNRASLQAWIGGSGWSALEPRRRFLFTAESLRLIGRPGARPAPAIAAMWQTLLNSFTFGHNVALGRLGRATATEAEEPWQRRLDLAISLLATPLAMPIAALAELLAAAVGRGGRLRLGGGLGE